MSVVYFAREIIIPMCYKSLGSNKQTNWQAESNKNTLPYIEHQLQNQSRFWPKAFDYSQDFEIGKFCCTRIVVKMYVTYVARKYLPIYNLMIKYSSESYRDFFGIFFSHIALSSNFVIKCYARAMSKRTEQKLVIWLRLLYI